MSHPGQTPYRPPRRLALFPDGRRAEAKLYKRSVAQLTELASGEPTALQRRWIDQAAGLQVQLHLMTRRACSADKVPPADAKAYAAVSRQYTALVDRVVRGAPDRKHERQERPEAPALVDLASLIDGDTYG